MRGYTATLLLALASPAFGAGFYENDLNGKTVLLDAAAQSCNGMKVALASDSTGNVRHHGCWVQHVHSVVILWDVGKATVVPTAAVTWDDKKPSKPARGGTL